MREAKVSTDPFDLEKLEMSDELRVPNTIAEGKLKRRRQHFVQVPMGWVEALRVARYINTYRVALYLLYQHWKDRGRSPIPVSNVALALAGVSRREKWRALVELERFGLIEVVRRARKAPLVTIREHLIMRHADANHMHHYVS
jgi:hypothetical protein